MAMTLVETVSIGSGGAASIEFTNIPQTGKDLLCVLNLRSDYNVGAATFTYTYLRANNDSATNYSWRQLFGDGASTSSSSSSGNTLLTVGGIPKASATANTFNNTSIYISNYTSTSARSISIDSVSEDNTSTAPQLLVAGSYAGASSISSLEIGFGFGNFAQYSTASLYIIS